MCIRTSYTMYYTLFPIIRKFRFKIDFLFPPIHPSQQQQQQQHTYTKKKSFIEKEVHVRSCTTEYIILEVYIHDLRG